MSFVNYPHLILLTHSQAFEVTVALNFFWDLNTPNTDTNRLAAFPRGHLQRMSVTLFFFFFFSFSRMTTMGRRSYAHITSLFDNWICFLIAEEVPLLKIEQQGSFPSWTNCTQCINVVSNQMLEKIKCEFFRLNYPNSPHPDTDFRNGLSNGGLAAPPSFPLLRDYSEQRLTISHFCRGLDHSHLLLN